MFKKKGRGANIRRSAEDAEHGGGIIDEDEQKPVVVMRKSRPAPSVIGTSGSKSKLSFDQEDDSTTAPSVKKSLRQLSLNLPAVAESTAAEDHNEGHSVYSKEVLQSLLETQRKSNSVRSSVRTEAQQIALQKIIPDAAEIYSVKKKRELMRQRGVAEAGEEEEEFIALDVEQRRDHSKKRDSDSDEECAAIRQEEDDEQMMEGFAEDYESENNRIAFGHAAVKELQRRQLLEMKQVLEDTGAIYDDQLDENGMPIENIEDEYEEEDEAVIEWERQQIMKGARSTSARNEVLAGDQKFNQLLKMPAKVPRVPQLGKIPNFGEILSGMEKNLALFQEDYNENFSGLSFLMKAKSEEESTLGKTENLIHSSGQKYNFFQEFRSWLDNFTGWMDSKMPDLDRLENQFFSQTYLETRQSLNNSGSLLNCLLDFAINNENFSDIPEGSPDQNSSEIRTPWLTLMNIEIFDKKPPIDQDLIKTLETMCNDTEDSFVNIKSILARFLTWRRAYARDFNDAFVNLSIPGALEFFVRRSLITEWNPLGVHDQSINRYRDLDSLSWHVALNQFNSIEYDTSLVKDLVDENLDGPSDEDNLHEILLKIAEKFVIPFLRRLIRGDRAPHSNDHSSAFDPYSPRQCYFLIQAVDNITFYFTDSFKLPAPFITLMEVITERFRTVIRETRETCIVPEVRLSATNSDQRLNAWSHSCYRLMQLLHNVLYVDKHLSEHLRGTLPENLTFTEFIEARHLLSDLIFPAISKGITAFSAIGASFVGSAIDLLERLIEIANSSSKLLEYGGSAWQQMLEIVERVQMLADQEHQSRISSFLDRLKLLQ